MSDTVDGRWAEIFGPRYLPVTTILALGVSLFAFNVFLSATALPSAVQELGGIEVISWATTLYLVFAIVGGAAAALIKRRLGSRLALIGLASVFLVGTLIAASAGAMPQVLVGRAVQGLGECADESIDACLVTLYAYCGSILLDLQRISSRMDLDSLTC